jgi:pilus assembly protein CpaE
MADSDKIRVLIVDDNSETRENIRKLIQFEGDIEVVGAARTGLEGIEIASETNPDVVIMDINMPDMDGITATELIRRKNPAAQIVILSVQNDANYMRKAMLAGARDFLQKPPSIEELSTALHRAGKMAKEEKDRLSITAAMVAGTSGKGAIGKTTQGKVIVVYSPKGGTGSTTIATNIAIAFHDEENTVAVVDGNLQYGDVAVFNNEQPKNTILDLAPRSEELDAEIVKEVMINHTATGISLLAAPTRPELAEKVNGEQFSKVVEYLRQMYNYIVVDTSSYLTDITLAAMDCADVIILITTQEIPAIKNSKAFLSLADAFNINRQRIFFIMNKYDKRITLGPKQISDSLKQEIVSIIPFDDKIVMNAVNRGVPFMVDNKIQPIGKSISTLADQVKEKLSKLEALEVEKLGKM